MSTEQDHNHTMKDEDEIPASKVLALLLDDEELLDVNLQGNDGIIVPAIRSILAVKSRVFRRMLLGQFKEANSSLVILDYPSRVLRILVDYCHTDRLVAIQDATDQVQAVRTAVTLLDAADFFGLPSLVQKTQAMVVASVEQSTATAFAALDQIALTALESPLHESTKAAARKLLRVNIPALIDSSQLGRVHSSVIESILKDEFVEATEFTLFQLVKAWFEKDTSSPFEDKTRDEIAKELIGHIKLHLIAPSRLTAAVANSGLVPPSKLAQVYQTQALEAERRNASFYDCLRYPPTFRWKQAKSTTASLIGDTNDVIDCPLMNSGNHTWSLRIREVSGEMLLGAWLFDGHGRKTLSGYCSNMRQPIDFGISNTRSTLQFGQGDIVRVRLSFEDARIGTLSAAIGDGQFFHCHMAQPNLQNGWSGWLPAVACLGDASQGHIEFLGFDGKRGAKEP